MISPMENQGYCISPNYHHPTLLLYQPVYTSAQDSVNTKTGAPLKQLPGLHPMTAAGAPVRRGVPEEDKEKNGQKNRLYKTEICRSWEEHGKCNYGDRCQYAHGVDEKRPVPRHPKYKTEYCRTYHQTGYCPYGPRCHFIHGGQHEIPSAPLTVVASSVLGSSGGSPVPSSLGSESPNSFSPGLLSSDEDPFLPSQQTFSWPSPAKELSLSLAALQLSAAAFPDTRAGRLPVFQRLSSGSG